MYHFKTYSNQILKYSNYNNDIIHVNDSKSKIEK